MIPEWRIALLRLVNVFRWEVLVGLWFRRTLMRNLLRSSRDREVARILRSREGKELFSFRRIVGSRAEAVVVMAYLSFAGCAAGTLIAGSLMGAARVLGFPSWLVFLTYFVGLCSWVTMMLGYGIGRLGPTPPENLSPEYSGDIGADFDVENNPRVGIGVSVCGIALSLAIAGLLFVHLPYPSTWG